jgi:hypothetical protein
MKKNILLGLVAACVLLFSNAVMADDARTEPLASGAYGPSFEIAAINVDDTLYPEQTMSIDYGKDGADIGIGEMDGDQTLQAAVCSARTEARCRARGCCEPSASTPYCLDSQGNKWCVDLGCCN